VQELDNGIGTKGLSSFGHVYSTDLNPTQAEELYAECSFLSFVHTASVSTEDEADLGEQDMFRAISSPTQSRVSPTEPVLPL
jgi:hypothetical protein